MSELIYGKSPLREAIRAKRRDFEKIYYAKNIRADDFLRETLVWAETQKVRVQTVERSWFEQKLPHCQTQGWVAQVSAFPNTPWREFFQHLPQETSSLLLALDQVQDPQNVGAILRSAECCGVQHILVPQDRACPMSPAVSRASAGALEHLSIIPVPNLGRALQQLQKSEYWVVGTQMDAPQNAFELNWPEKSVLVLGSEGQGMRQNIEKKCDFLINLPLKGKIQSLNVASAATACLFLWQNSLKK